MNIVLHNFLNFISFLLINKARIIPKKQLENVAINVQQIVHPIVLATADGKAAQAESGAALNNVIKFCNPFHVNNSVGGI